MLMKEAVKIGKEVTLAMKAESFIPVPAELQEGWRGDPNFPTVNCHVTPHFKPFQTALF